MLIFGMRILKTDADLFYLRGIDNIGINEVIKKAGVVIINPPLTPTAW
jgi:AcrR family transcriptional regulator